MGRESVHLKPTAISNRLQTLPDPKSPRKNPKIIILRKIPKSKNEKKQKVPKFKKYKRHRQLVPVLRAFARPDNSLMGRG